MAHAHSDVRADGKKKALLIAVEDNAVKEFPKLYHAHRDAKQLRRLLTEVFGYLEDDIVLMMDDRSLPRELWPTRTNIRKQIQRFVQGVSAGDHLFFYCQKILLPGYCSCILMYNHYSTDSGHGRQVSCHHHTEPDGLDEEIYTCNGKEILDNDLKKWLVDPLPRGCKLFALWDSCHSQTILDLDHYTCNEPADGQRIRQRREFSPPSTFRQVIRRCFRRKGNLRNAFSTTSGELRGRPMSRASVSITAFSAGSSPHSSKWVPFSAEVIQRVQSPSPWHKCNGKCPSTEGDTNRAHVISLSACKDNEIAFDDCYNGTVTTFFIDHLRENPKSTLKELLVAIRKRVDEITKARQEYDVETRATPRRTTFTNGSRVKTDWAPPAVRRNTEVNTLDDLLQYNKSLSAREEDDDRYSQVPSYSSHYRLDLKEPVDL